MGNSSSKQTPQEVTQPVEPASTSTDKDSQVETEQPLAEDVMQHDEGVTADQDERGVHRGLAEDTSTPVVTLDGGDSFKVPSVSTNASAPAIEQPLSPNSTSLRALPADIEHILSLGANQDELAKLRPANAKSVEGRSAGGEIEQVIKELREKYQQEGENVSSETTDLSRVEQEMQEQGIVRNSGSAEQAEDTMEQDSDGEGSSSSDSDSDDSSSLGSDSTSRAGAGNAMKRSARNRRKVVAADSGDEDGDSDSGMGGSKTAPKTEHELAEPEPTLPDVIKIDEAAEIAKFGKVESVIETVVVVKADTSGDWRVLDEGTVVCWEDKTVIGTIFETFGSVQQPFYSLRFPSNSPPNPAIFTLQKSVFYAPSHAQFVFTRDLRSLKGSDASNVWDEEVGAGEVEFSDDEEEAEYRKRLKQERKARKESATPGPSSGRQQSRAQSNVARSPSRAPPAGHASLPARPAISYADTEEPVASTSSSSGVVSSSSIFDMYGPPVSVPTPSNAKPGPRADMGDKPPPGRIGRKMFERDTGKRLEEGEQVEFEFSDGEGEDSSADGDSDDGRMNDSKKFKGESFGSRDQQSVGGRGRGRGRGGATDSRGRGRGRGGGHDRGGSRGRGGARGGRGGRGGERHVAPLPARASPQGSRGPATGLPPRPQFDLPEGSGTASDERMSIDASQAPAFAPPIRFGEPTTFGGSGSAVPSGSHTVPAYNPSAPASSLSPQNQTRPTPRQPASSSSIPGYNPQMPSSSYPSYPGQPNAYYRAAPPMHAPQQAYYPMPQSSSVGSHSSAASGGAYSPHQPQAAFVTPSPASLSGTGASGHVNPRFLAQQQQQQQPPSQYPPGYYGGYGYGAGGYGGYQGGGR